MRETKYRGCDTANGEWIYGNLCKNIKGNYGIQIEQGEFKWKFVKTVDIESLGQYTGFKDKNYKEIYERDIVKINGHKYSVKFEIGSFMLVRCSDNTDMYDQFENCWNDDVYPLSQFYWENDCEEDLIYQCEIIGNIYDNPELLNA
ncbi:hypothetical protein FDC45_15920 [Clostridium botulinum]|uniref:YopX protein domain-containing protein n=1 Tax=Clostridium botulinum TaxID=1491 RepID=A0A846JCH4_CLOBO|nr:YopX family protein [Clostridium botulinum]ACA57406.1 phage protein [Clostridium botulinum A3 str. Loch Maree]NFH64984.1 hypothetical protein [Clostridium botulinum]NFJ09563.1 hypothetical protein [Clostridium botulinum]NFK16532.1 hypothetical protein [Clostridium botulinum]NFM93497.1 hypothetical protein [Clostridium botulinum]